MKVAFNHPKTKVGEVVAVIPSHTPRNPYVVTYLDGFHEEIELRLGSTAIWPEESFFGLGGSSQRICEDPARPG